MSFNKVTLSLFLNYMYQKLEFNASFTSSSCLYFLLTRFFFLLSSLCLSSLYYALGGPTAGEEMSSA